MRAVLFEVCNRLMRVTAMRYTACSVVLHLWMWVGGAYLTAPACNSITKQHAIHACIAMKASAAIVLGVLHAAAHLCLLHEPHSWQVRHMGHYVSFV